MENVKYCQVNGHVGNAVSYICTYKDCKEFSIWLCVDCGVQ